MRSLLNANEISSISRWGFNQRVKLLEDHEDLNEYPFLRAALEDILELHSCAARESVNRRHVICLMFDAIEFMLYETLLLNDRDIYRSGQNTIGFDDALAGCHDIGIEIPLIGTIRQIQKHRGDAKHHAQTPDESAYDRLFGNFGIICSRLINEQFEHSLSILLAELPVLSHRVALFESYRRRRNHNWEQAYRFALGALVRKHQEMFGNQSGMSFNFAAGHKRQLHMLEEEISKSDYRVAPADAVKEIKSIVTRVKEALVNDGWEEGATLVGTAYSTVDRLLPGIFDINKAKQLSSRLFQPDSFVHSGPMAWATVWGKRGSDEEKLVTAVENYLRSSDDVVKKFGEPHYETDDDRYWRWWEFAIFDDERWHTFHLDTSFRVSLESGPDSSRDQATSTKLLYLILTEFQACGSGAA
ncbi:MAG: hypothetical protein OXE57_19510 [Alphaproteobacteria bacterium]|nr:hypothetical protein [Alphaproteobacteria bacterium]